MRLKRHSNTVPGPQVPTAAGRGEHQKERGLKGPWVGGWWHGRVGRVRAGWCARRGREGDAWRGAGCEGGGGWSTRGCSPRGRAGSVWLEGLPCSPFAHARLRFFSRSAGPTRARRPPPRPRACSGSSARISSVKPPTMRRGGRVRLPSRAAGAVAGGGAAATAGVAVAGARVAVACAAACAGACAAAVVRAAEEAAVTAH